MNSGIPRSIIIQHEDLDVLPSWPTRRASLPFFDQTPTRPRRRRSIEHAHRHRHHHHHEQMNDDSYLYLGKINVDADEHQVEKHEQSRRSQCDQHQNKIERRTKDHCIDVVFHRSACTSSSSISSPTPKKDTPASSEEHLANDQVYGFITPKVGTRPTRICISPDFAEIALLGMSRPCDGSTYSNHSRWSSSPSPSSASHLPPKIPLRGGSGQDEQMMRGRRKSWNIARLVDDHGDVGDCPVRKEKRHPRQNQINDHLSGTVNNSPPGTEESTSSRLLPPPPPLLKVIHVEKIEI